MKILGIESSCDETSAAVVENGSRLLSVVTATSLDQHIAFGGVVPEIAARSHIESIIPVINQALFEAKYGQVIGLDGVKGSKEKRMKRTNGTLSESRTQLTQQSAKNTKGMVGFAQLESSVIGDLWGDIDGIAVTYGAGLSGSLLVGVMTARTLAITNNKPLYAINHVEGHIYANFLTSTSLPKFVLPKKQPDFPLLGLIVSGGHSQLVIWENHFDYQLLGQTHDDAIGEAFDKVAKILGLPYPGGPSIATAAKDGDAFAFDFPKAKMPGKYDFSFSGPKTAVLRAAQEEIGEDYTFPSHKLAERLSEAQKANIAASFQRIAVETVVDKTVLAFEEFRPSSVVIGGGVAANAELRQQLAKRLPLNIDYTDPKLCTDNGAMIATLGFFHMNSNRPTADPYSLAIEPNLSM